MLEDVFSMGIEEEYLLVDPETRNVVADPPEAVLKGCEQIMGKRVAPEFMRCQIEIGTTVCTDHRHARAQLRELRRGVHDVAAAHGLAFIAASTHPFADWREQRATPRERYEELIRDLRAAIGRMLICGMHVHVGIEDEELRYDVFAQAAYFMPHFLALSTSSPFWQGELSGLHAYRIAVFDGLPRSGLPERFAHAGEYKRLVDILSKTGLLEDASKIWWDIRPSVHYPTLEMRITEVCPRLEDAIAIACAYRCICRMLTRLYHKNQRWREYSRFLVGENRWLAQRYGATHGLIDFGRGEIVPMAELIDEMIDLTAEDAQYFGCTAEMSHLRTILSNGTSAARQIATYEEAVGAGADREAALFAVVDQLISETAEGLH